MDAIGIINYGMGNITSVKNALSKLNYVSLVIETPSDLRKVDRYILPGVGAFKMAMENLKKSTLIDELQQLIVVEKKPILGLCLGMQLFFDYSEEHGISKGLGWIKGRVVNLKDKLQKCPVPHMGWNSIEIQRDSSIVRQLASNDLDFYFVHSYYCICDKETESIAKTQYEVLMDVIVQKENIYGCQFHPEKSQKNGLQVLKNFCEL